MVCLRGKCTVLLLEKTQGNKFSLKLGQLPGGIRYEAQGGGVGGNGAGKI